MEQDMESLLNSYQTFVQCIWSLWSVRYRIHLYRIMKETGVTLGKWMNHIYDMKSFDDC